MLKSKGFLRNALTAVGSLICAVCLICALALLDFGTTAEAEEESRSVVYSDFSSVPSDWKVYEKSDTYEKHTTEVNDDGTVSVKSINISDDHTTSSDKYYGLTYLLGDETWEDFTFTITFKMTNAEDARRWLGVVYHTNFNTEGYMAGYIMNYRYSGASASSAVTYERLFLDDAEGNGNPLSDGKYHTMKIVMEGTTAKHYMDGTLIKTFDTTTKNGSLGGELTSGGFALIINGSVVTIKEVTITDKIEEEGVKTDRTLVDTYQAETGLINAPTVVSWVKDADDLDKLTAAAASSENERPTNAILFFDGNQKIVGEDGSELGDFSEIYAQLNHNVIPVLYVSDSASADALVNFLNTKTDILDMTVISSDADLIKKVRSAKTAIRGALLCEPTENIYEDIIAVANSSYANIVVLPESMATTDNVSYIQKRFKTAWVMTDGESSIDYYQAINSGAYGIVAEDFSEVYDILETYPEGSTSRTSFVVGHRGTPQTKNQNSISGLLNASEANISHVEFDVYLTTDKEIVLMHNTTLEETTNVENVNGGVDTDRNIETMTLAEIRQYQLDQYGMEEIPVLGDVLEELVKTDLVFILEIKSTQNEIVSLIKEQLDKYDCYDQVVIISFSLPTLGEVKDVMPNVPTAYLGNASVGSFASDLVWLGNYNTNVDMTYGSATVELNEMLRDRGFIGWYWTYATTLAIRSAAMQGFVGLTADAAETYVNNPNEKYLSPERLSGNSDTVIENGKTLSVGDSIPLTLTLYNGTTQQVEGTVFALDETENGYRVIACYLFESAYSTKNKNYDETMYTEVFTVSKEQETPPVDSGDSGSESSDDGCGSALNYNVFLTTAAISFALISLTFAQKDKKKKNCKK